MDEKTMAVIPIPITYNIYKVCETCKGISTVSTNDADGHSTTGPCPTCAGTGKVLWGTMVTA